MAAYTAHPRPIELESSRMLGVSLNAPLAEAE